MFINDIVNIFLNKYNFIQMKKLEIKSWKANKPNLINNNCMYQIRD